MQQLSLEAQLKAKRNSSARPNDGQPEVLCVSDVNRAVKQTLEGQFPILWIQGEISNFKPHSSGHWYFSLKDSKAQIAAVMFRGFNLGVRFKPTDGMEVIVRGKITVYEPRGNYQIFCEMMEPVGAGAQQMAFEQLKAKLQSEGLFESSRKRALPVFPQHVGVVTSPTGAAIRDILNVLGRRFRGLQVTVIPAVVQGDQAPKQIVKAIELANLMQELDVLIIGRGGGSSEDLWCFNDESVARAIAASRIPTISAVGHEIDFTIADFVADVRAPTPSAAAELVVKSAAELQEKVGLYGRHLAQQMAYVLQLSKRHLQMQEQRLAVVDPKRRLQDLILRCDELQSRLQLAIERQFEDEHQHLALIKSRLGSPQTQIDRVRQKISELSVRLKGLEQLARTRWLSRLGQAAARLDNLSPLKVLDRGFAIATKNNYVILSTNQLSINDHVSVRLSEGVFEAQVLTIQAKGEL